MACFMKKKRSRLHQSLTQQRDEAKSDAGPEIRKGKMIELSQSNMQAFLKKLDVVLVLFYLPHDAGLSAWTMKHFTKAAKLTQRPNHAYAVVDCEKNGSLCIDEGALNMPTLKMYSKGKDVGLNPEQRGHLYKDMKNWVETFDPNSCQV